MKQLSLAALALAVFSLHPIASAQQATPFMTVDAVNVDGTGSLVVTGVVQGQSTRSTARISFNYAVPDKAAFFEACHRQLLLALAKPGQYVVQGGLNLCNVALASP